MGQLCTEKISAHLKKYLPAYLLGVLFFYCLTQMPLHYDQLVAAGGYTEYNALNFITGYCWYWVQHVNGRFFSTLISGFLEQNYTLYFLVSCILLSVFPVACARIFAKRKKDEGRIIWISALIILLLSRAIELEVLSYALFIYIAPVLMVLYLTHSLKDLIPECGKSSSVRSGRRYLILVLILGLWLENITFSLFIISVCLFIWDWAVNHRKNMYLFAGILLSLFCMWLMVRLRFTATVFADSDYRSGLARIAEKITTVLITTFSSNAALTAVMAIIACLKMACCIQKQEGWKKLCAGILMLFWTYIAITHLFLSYQTAITSAKSIPVPLMGGQMTALPLIPETMLLPADNRITAPLYLLFSLSLMIPVLQSEYRLKLLTVYGFAMTSLGILFFTNELFGSRVITPSLLLLCVTMLAVCADTLPDLKRGPVPLLKLSAVLIAALILLRLDYYYCRYTEIGKTNRYNEKLIGYAVERQGLNEWDYASDTLVLKGYWGDTELFIANMAAGDPHFLFFCQYYHLNPKTQVIYVYN